MKRVLALLFTLVVAFAMTMPVFAQEAAGGSTETTAKTTKKTKKTKAAKTKKSKSATTTAPSQ